MNAIMIEAINQVCMWLHRQGCGFTLAYAQELAPEVFRVVANQHVPAETQRAFDIAQSDVPDVWNVVEMNLIEQRGMYGPIQVERAEVK